MIEKKEAKGMKFNSIWYRSRNKGWIFFKAYEKSGTLEIEDEYIKFSKGEETVLIKNIKSIEYSIYGKDFFRHWVKIKYANGNTAYFCDGSYFGWGGMFNGTLKIFNAIKSSFNNIIISEKKFIYRKVILLLLFLFQLSFIIYRQYSKDNPSSNSTNLSPLEVNNAFILDLYKDLEKYH